MTVRHALFVFVLFLNMWALVPAASAQARTRALGEVAGFTGGVFGIGAHGTVGGGVGFQTSTHLMPIFEISYIPLGSEILRSSISGATASSSRAYDVNGGLHIIFPGRSAAVPYAAVGIGLLRSSFDISGPNRDRTSAASGSDTDFAFNFGAGIRYFVREKWGFRPEIKVFTGTHSYARLAIGFFYQSR